MASTTSPVNSNQATSESSASPSNSNQPTSASSARSLNSNRATSPSRSVNSKQPISASRSVKTTSASRSVSFDQATSASRSVKPTSASRSVRATSASSRSVNSNQEASASRSVNPNQATSASTASSSDSSNQATSASTTDPRTIQNPIKEVRSIVSIRDDVDLEAVTIRSVLLGLVSCVVLAFVGAKALSAENPFDIDLTAWMICTYYAGNLMAKVLPQKDVHVPWTMTSFSLNPGKFNYKENALISVSATVGRIIPVMLQTIFVSIAHYKQEVYFSSALLSTVSSQLISFLFVGVFLNWATSPEFWWPSELVDVIFLRTLHEEENGPPGRMSNKKFAVIFIGISFLYQLVPGWFFPAIQSISPVCRFFKRSVTAQQVGAGRKGLGAGAGSLDWSSVTDFTSSPLSTPPLVICNAMVGIFLAFYILTPSIYFSNAFQTRKFPMLSFDVFDDSGRKYDVTKVMTDGLTLDVNAYKGYSPIFLSAFTIVSYCLKWASIFTSIIHVGINYGRSIWQQMHADEYNRVMENYPPIPRSWCFNVFICAFALALTSYFIGFGPENEVSFVGIFTASGTASLLVAPLGVILATTSQMIPIIVVFDLVGRFLHPNKPIQNMIFRSFAYQTAVNTVSFLSCLKFANYMKVPPRATFAFLVGASTVGSLVSFLVVWGDVQGLANVCAKRGDCPWLDSFYQSTNAWGVAGPLRVISDGGYTTLLISIVTIAIIVQLLLCLSARKWKVLKAINLPVILGATSGIPPAVASNVNSWMAVGLGLPEIVKRCHSNWSPDRQYLLSISFTVGTSLMNTILYVIRNRMGRNPPIWGWWSTPGDHCPLADCPTAPGILKEGCPQG